MPYNITGIIYLFSLALLMMIIELPWSIYRTFVLEERFGFNKTTFGTFVKDMFKTIALSVALGTPLLAGVLWFFEFSGDRAWLYCWITTSVVSLVLTFLAPKYILPCFNKLEPLEDGVRDEFLLSHGEILVTQYVCRNCRMRLPN